MATWSEAGQPLRWCRAIFGVMLFGIFAPLAWAIANKELAAIDAGRRLAKNRTTANAGRLLGVVGTVVCLGAVLLFVLALVGIIKVS